MTATLADIITKLEGAKKQGAGFQAKCPVHDDKQASLSLKLGNEGRPVLHCFAGCESRDVLAALGMTWADFFPPKEARPKSRRVAEYTYEGADGSPLYRKVRMEPKGFFVESFDGSTWKMGMGDAKPTLYRLPQLLKGIASGDIILLVEGEKDVATLEALGYTATTAGAVKSWRPEFAKILAGATVCLIPDNDEPGLRLMATVALDLLGVAESVYCKRLPNLRAKEDATDFASRFGLEALRDELNRDEGLFEIHSQADIEEHIWRDVTADAAPVTATVTVLPKNTYPLTSDVTDVTDVTVFSEPSTLDVDGGELLDRVREFLTRYVAFPSPEAADATALWAAHTWVAPRFYTSPRLAFLSAEKGSGKTRALECLANLCRKPRQTINTSVAALFRIIEKEAPTILLDEADTVFNDRNGDGKEDLRGILNSGYKKGSTVDRCEGRDQRVRSFKVFAPVALAGIGNLPDTIMSRSIVIRMKRRAPGETVAPYRERVAEQETAKLRVDLEAWTKKLRDVGEYEPALPEGVEDRNAECWEPLIALADKAGGEWPSRARQAALVLIGLAAAEDHLSIGLRLLTDIREVFDATGAERLATTEMLDHLHKMEESPWADFYGRPLDARNLGQKLRPYGVKTKALRTASGVIKGYARSDFEDPWSRYVPMVPKKPLQTLQTVTPQVTALTEAVTKPLQVAPEAVTTDEMETREDALLPL